MNSRTHILDIAHLAQKESLLLSTWEEVMEYFKDYDQRIIGHEVHVLRGAGGMEAKVTVTIRAKLALIQFESHGNVSGTSWSEKVEIANKVPLWIDDLTDKAMLKAGIDSSRARCVGSGSIVVYYEPRTTTEEQIKSQKEGAQ
jgi:hypothetical protein